MPIFNVNDFGAVADGKTINTAAFTAAAAACQAAGRATLRVPVGTFVTGVFELFSGTTLLIERGGRVLASPRLEDHQVGHASVGLLFARDARDITVTGEGVLDGNAALFFHEDALHRAAEGYTTDTWQARHGIPYGSDDLSHGPLLPKTRPGNMLIFARCQNVRLEKLTITGAPYWTVHIADCDDVAIDHLKIDNDRRHPNNDGVHLSTCRRVKISHCDISCGDDAIALTGFREAHGETQIALGLSGIVGTSDDIDISDCVLTSNSAGVRVGYGPNPIRNVRMRGLDIRRSNRGIGIFARESDVTDVVIDDCRIETALFHGNWWGRGEPIHLSAVRGSTGGPLFQIRRVRLSNIEATGENAVTLFAEEPGAIEDVEFRAVRSTLRRGPLFESWGGNLDLRPAADPRLAITAGGTAPLWAIGVSGLRCVDCQWRLDPSAGKEFSADAVIRATP